MADLRFSSWPYDVVLSLIDDAVRVTLSRGALVVALDLPGSDALRVYAWLGEALGYPGYHPPGAEGE